MNTTNHWTTIVLIALSIAVTVPLGLAVIGIRVRPVFLVGAGGCATVSLAVEPGTAAALLALPWLGLSIRTLYHAAAPDIRRRPVLVGIGRLMKRWLPTIALVWWANAALWLVAHRAGWEPLGFGRAITLLTVGHFHHAGFGLTAMFVAAHRRLRSRTTLAMGIVHQFGMVTVAAGLTFDDHLEVVGAVLLTASLALWTVVALGLARSADRSTRPLLALSAIAWLLPMVYAVAWALNPFLPDPIVTTFTTMLRYHAAINAVGLVLAGLVGLLHLPTDGIEPRPSNPLHESEIHDAHPATTDA